MKLLMITRRVDRLDARAGFTYYWVGMLGQLVTELHVICLEKGDTSGLPANCKIYSLGKEKGKNRIEEFIAFQKYAKELVPHVDGIFSHQNPEYGILIGPWAKYYHKKLISWYVHKKVTWKLRLLNFFSDAIVTASAESFRLPSDKVKILHHGIDTDFFSFFEKQPSSEYRILTISRLSRSKNIDRMVKLLGELKERSHHDIKLLIAGDVQSEKEQHYLNEMLKYVQEKKLDSSVAFLGHVKHLDTVELYHDADLFLNFSETGSLDKAVLEAMSSGIPVLVTNEAFQDAVSSIDPRCFSEKKDVASLANAVESLKAQPLTHEQRVKAREYVATNHDIRDLLKRIVDLYV